MERMIENLSPPDAAAFDRATPVHLQAAPCGRHYRKFVLLTHGRTGSSHMVSLLGSHPAVLSFDEVFHPHHVRFDYPGFPREDLPQLIRFRNEQLPEFLDQLVWPAYPRAIQAAGFKLLYTHLLLSKPLLHHLLAQTDICFIHLKRRNLFRCLVSLKYASLTSEWSLPGPSRAAASVQFALSVSECTNFFYLTRKFERYGDEVIHQQAALEVYYEDLLAGPERTLSAVLDFVEADPVPLVSKYRRQNVYPLAATVTNYEDLKRYFKDTEWADFFDE
jgi:LPS sulfotransferase NodH